MADFGFLSFEYWAFNPTYLTCWIPDPGVNLPLTCCWAGRTSWEKRSQREGALGTRLEDLGFALIQRNMTH